MEDNEKEDIGFVDVLKTLLDRLSFDEKLDDKKKNNTSDSRLPNVLTAKEKKNIKNIGESFYEGLKTTYDKVKEGILTREKMIGNIKDVFKFPFKAAIGIKNTIKRGSDFLKKVFLIIAILGIVYYIFKDWVDNKLKLFFQNEDGLGNVLTSLQDKLTSTFEEISQSVREVINVINETFGGDTLVESLNNIITTALPNLLTGAMNVLAETLGKELGVEEAMKNNISSDVKSGILKEYELALATDPELRTTRQNEILLRKLQEYALNALGNELYTRNIGTQESKTGYLSGLDEESYKNGVYFAAELAKKQYNIPGDTFGYLSLMQLASDDSNEYERLLKIGLISLRKMNYSTDLLRAILLNYRNKEIDELRSKYGIAYRNSGQANLSNTFIESIRDELSHAILLINANVSSINLPPIDDALRALTAYQKLFLSQGDSLRSLEIKELGDRTKLLLGDADYVTELKKIVSIASLEEKINNFTSEKGVFGQIAESITSVTKELLNGVIKSFFDKLNVRFMASKLAEQEVLMEVDGSITSTQTINIDDNTKAIVNISTIDVSNIQDLINQTNDQELNVIHLIGVSTDAISNLNKRLIDYIEACNKTLTDKKDKSPENNLTIIQGGKDMSEELSRTLLNERIAFC